MSNIFGIGRSHKLTIPWWRIVSGICAVVLAAAIHPSAAAAGSTTNAAAEPRSSGRASSSTIALSNSPIDSPRFFVRQHYLDFLNREPDPAGHAFWTGQITQCGADPACIRAKRIDVSRAFWYSTEFLAMHPGLRNPAGVAPDFNNLEFIRLSYVLYLRRSPDFEGFYFWLGHLNRGNNYNHIIDAFLVSNEYLARFS